MTRALLIINTIPGQPMWDLWWAECHWISFSYIISVSSANSYSNICSISINYSVMDTIQSETDSVLKLCLVK
jgi:hypothetical protein